MPSFRMPFKPVACSIWLPTWSAEDDYGNQVPTYGEAADIDTYCCYAPGTSAPDTADDIEQGRPHGARVVVTFYLPKTVTGDLRGALIACYPADDQALSSVRFEVIGEPYSYPRDNTPGDYSWVVEAVRWLG